MKRELNVASAILFVLGIGHLSLTLVMDRERVAQWLGDGLWATVPLIPGTDVAALQTTTGFWAGWGSFSIPLLLVAGLIRHLARHQLPVPPWVGWGLVVWAFIGGLMLVPSPFFVGVIPGLLIVRVARETPSVPNPGSPEHPAAYGAATDRQGR